MMTTAADPRQVSEGLESLLQRGFCAVEGSLAPEQCALATEVLDSLIANGQARLMGDSDHVIHPLCPRDGRINDLFGEPTVLGIMAALFEDEVWLAHSGSRVTEPHHTARLGWHRHPYAAEEAQLPPGDPRRGERPRRVLCNWYLEGSSPETGPLLVLPRRFDDPLAPPTGEFNGPWPGELAVSCPPGSAVIFTIDLWHAALPGNGSQRRHLFGGHFQGRHNRRPHREDQIQEGPVMEECARRNPVFARLLR